MKKRLAIALVPVLLAGCGEAPFEPPAPEEPMTEEAYREQATSEMHGVLLADVRVMKDAVAELQAAAPAPRDGGWDAAADADAIRAMKASWMRARTAYERVEGALAPLFPDIDYSIDARYDDFLAQLAGKGGDPDLFDATGVTGMHAVERIVFADEAPARVVTFERSLPGYVPAAFPKTADEARSFKEELCQKLVADASALEERWSPSNIDAAIAFQGLLLLVEEQREKVQKAASNEEESRYAQRTMADLRDNLAGAQAVYAAFRPWIASKAEGRDIDEKVMAGFAALGRAYAAVPGASIPEPPATWSAERPSPQDLATPFGRLYAAVGRLVDPAANGSTIAELRRAAVVLGFEELGVIP